MGESKAKRHFQHTTNLVEKRNRKTIQNKAGNALTSGITFNTAQMSAFTISNLDQPLGDYGYPIGGPQPIGQNIPGEGTNAGFAFYLTSSQVPAFLNNVTLKTKNTTQDDLQNPQEMLVDVYLESLYPIDFGGITNEVWRKTNIPLSMDKDNYSTLSIDLPNPPVVNMSPDDNYYYVFILTPRLNPVFRDWRQYELGMAASGLDDRFMLGPITAERAGISDPQPFRISRGNPTVSMSASLEFSELDSPIREGASRANRLTGSRSDDLINGNDGNDVILGGIGDDVLQGGNGNDRIIGGNDSDQLIGGAGDDSLNGGNGNDWLTGGSGRDTFILSKGCDAITDYIAEEGRQDSHQLKGLHIL